MMKKYRVILVDETDDQVTVLVDVSTKIALLQEVQDLSLGDFPNVSEGYGVEFQELEGLGEWDTFLTITIDRLDKGRLM